ncbi:Ribosomal protein S6 modification protein [Caulifigura coniformis]|uniref:Ribosomal protein S6 modification protein n=1 Tax=Caulifigura coniformis TaxID=2527983 RepID=A0A517SJF9_9PLAN|nr:RimK family alpha-L-glutamate ligase [Caulifigura coniformis]QDT56247.1 Ribosomal protein S6 modification protein [Caulifigura coniformis]
MNIAILGNPDSWYVAELRRAARARSVDAATWDFTQLAASISADGHAVLHSGGAGRRLDAVIVRTMPPGSLEQVVFRMNLLARLEAAGTTVLNPPKAIECAVDKYLTTAVLQQAGLPVPETFVCESAAAALDALPRLGGDVVVKPLFGSEGRGIVRVSDPDLGVRVFRAIERTGGLLYLQRFVEHEGFDVRVLILDGQILGGMKRRSAGDFRTNVSRDAVAEPHQLTETERDYALRAAAATGASFAGVDLLYDRCGRLFVIEVNAVPGWRAFQKVSNMDVAQRVLETLISQCVRQTPLCEGHRAT